MLTSCNCKWDQCYSLFLPLVNLLNLSFRSQLKYHLLSENFVNSPGLSEFLASFCASVKITTIVTQHLSVYLSVMRKQLLTVFLNYPSVLRVYTRASELSNSKCLMSGWKDEWVKGWTGEWEDREANQWAVLDCKEDVLTVHSCDFIKRALSYCLINTTDYFRVNNHVFDQEINDPIPVSFITYSNSMPPWKQTGSNFPSPIINNLVLKVS